ncbi:MAG: hypothetical protein HS117_18535 [Verrucomicrobiaceae bacterium]|nr:hypothetical protein [Verrucomicrobiaceae bacterium]
MFTIVQNRGYEGILNHYLPGVQVVDQLGANEINALESAILNDINHVVGGGGVQIDHPLLPAIAVGIHLWGGRAGRNVFVQGGGFAQNCPIGVYGSMVNLLMTHPHGTPLPDGNWPAIMAIKGQFHQIGVSFLTKHLSFWSRATNSPIRLPILDRVVKQTFIHPNAPYPTWGDYTTYVNDINADRDVLVARGLIGIDLPAMERQLFNWAAAEQVQSWVR